MSLVARAHAEPVLEEGSTLEQEGWCAGCVDGALQGGDDDRGRDEPAHPPAGGGYAERALGVVDPLRQDRYRRWRARLGFQLRQRARGAVGFRHVAPVLR